MKCWEVLFILLLTLHSINFLCWNFKITSQIIKDYWLQWQLCHSVVKVIILHEYLSSCKFLSSLIHPYNHVFFPSLHCFFYLIKWLEIILFPLSMVLFLFPGHLGFLFFISVSVKNWISLPLLHILSRALCQKSSFISNLIFARSTLIY